MVTWLTTETPTFSQESDVVYGGLGTNCSETADECYIYCDYDYACGDTLDGDELHCPTNSNCNYCLLYCNGEYACGATTVYGHSCDILEIQVDEGAKVAKKMIVYAPDSGGSLNVTQTGLVGDDGFKQSRIHSTDGTDSISVHCRHYSSGNDECKELVIYGQDATSVDFTCDTDSDCEDIAIYCPTNSTVGMC